MPVCYPGLASTIWTKLLHLNLSIGFHPTDLAAATWSWWCSCLYVYPTWSVVKI
jgi:hypothetical protein